MELTTKGRYAVMAMADLASHAASRASSAAALSIEAAAVEVAADSPSAVPLSQIAERQRLSLAYLEQLFVPLRRAGLVESARGRTGGYRLARTAAEISIADIMEAVEEDTQFTRCSGEDPRCSRDTPCITHGLWQQLSDVTSSFFQNVTLADVIAGTPFRAPATVAAKSVPSHRIYFDYNATSPLRSAARAAMIAAMDVAGNPSSVHAEGRAARAIIEAARAKVAALVGAKPSEVVFTSGATEANTWVMAQPWSTIFVAGVEHDSVLAATAASAAEVVPLSTGRDGVIRFDAMISRVASGLPLGRALLTVQTANNETGVLQPIADIAGLAREHGVLLHTDAVQAAGRVPIDFAHLGLDLLSLSAHKLGGPKGIGALIIRDHLDLAPLLRGGGQERRRRAGTENLVAIAGFGAAAEAARLELAAMPRIAALRDRLEALLRETTPDAIIIGAESPRLANTSSIVVPGRSAETLVIKLDLAGIAISAGAACSSGKVGASHVLEAMGLGPELAKGAVRISLGFGTTDNDLAAFAATWKTIVSHPALAA